jgi:hypothetical protein
LNGWFARVGLPLSPDELAEIDALIGVVAPRSSREVLLVTSWPGAMQFVCAAEMDATWWDQEEEEREWLWTRAAELRSESALLQDIARMQASLDAQIRAAAVVAGAGDPIIASEATGSALLAAQQNALAAIAGEPPGHRFMRKFALFERGRWPLGYHASRFVIF